MLPAQAARNTQRLDQLAALPRVYATTIPPEYIDRNGHMNVQYYFVLFGHAARAIFSAVGIDDAYIEREKSGIFALKQFVTYTAEVYDGQQVALRVRLLERSAKRLHLMYFLANETTSAVAATMEALTSHADLTIRRTSPFPPQVAATIDEMLGRHQRLAWDAPLCGVIAV